MSVSHKFAEALEFAFLHFIRMLIVIPFHFATVLIYTPFIQYALNHGAGERFGLETITFWETYGLFLVISMGLGLVAGFAFMTDGRQVNSTYSDLWWEDAN